MNLLKLCIHKRDVFFPFIPIKEDMNHNFVTDGEESQKLVMELLKKKYLHPIYLDTGACIGRQTKIALELGYEVIAIETNENYLNQIPDHPYLTKIHAGHTTNENPNNMFFIHPKTGFVCAIPDQSVYSKQLPIVSFQQGIPNKQIHLWKIDIEGNEYELILDYLKTKNPPIDNIIFEFTIWKMPSMEKCYELFHALYEEYEHLYGLKRNKDDGLKTLIEIKKENLSEIFAFFLDKSIQIDIWCTKFKNPV